MEIKKMKIRDLQKASFNPKSRISKELARLRSSIERIGLVYPVAVTKDGRVVDGHRRLECCRQLGWEEIPVLIVAVDDLNVAYAEVNSTAKVHTGAQVLAVYLKQPSAVSPGMRKRIERVEERFGRSLLRRLFKENLSVGAVGWAQTVATYCLDESDDFVLKAVNWIIERRNQHLIRSYMRLNQSPKRLWSAIRENKPLNIKTQA
jgi:hypothetical protein